MKKHFDNSLQWEQEFTVKPIGFVISDLKEPSLVANREGITSNNNSNRIKHQAREIKNLVSRIIIRSSLNGILDGLEQFSHALVLYWPHLTKNESRNLTHVHPMGREDLDKVGVFATCSPARPNPLLVTAVKVLKVNENILTVQGLEAVNESPVLDIKPYNRHYLEVTDLRLADWMENIEHEIGS